MESLAITKQTQVAWHVRHREYVASKMWHCGVCNSDMKLVNRCNHERTKKHQMREHLQQTGEPLSYPNKALQNRPQRPQTATPLEPTLFYHIFMHPL